MQNSNLTEEEIRAYIGLIGVGFDFGTGYIDWGNKLSLAEDEVTYRRELEGMGQVTEQQEERDYSMQEEREQERARVRQRRRETDQKRLHKKVVEKGIPWVFYRVKEIENQYEDRQYNRGFSVEELERVKRIDKEETRETAELKYSIREDRLWKARNKNHHKSTRGYYKRYYESPMKREIIRTMNKRIRQRADEDIPVKMRGWYRRRYSIDYILY